MTKAKQARDILQPQIVLDRDGMPDALCPDCEAVLEHAGYEGIMVCPGCGQEYYEPEQDDEEA